MVRKKLDERIRTLIHRGVATKQRTMMVIVGDYGKDQVPNLHQILSKASVKARPNVLWCYKKELGFSTHKQKRMKKLKRDKARGLLNSNSSSNNGVDVHRDNFELFVSGSDINWCYYKDTHRVLGTTNGVLVLQDFEALTPNLLARTIETVEGGGLIIFLLRSVKSLTQLYTMTMDVHARYRTESGGDVVPRFNERFMLSLANCRNCLVMDDELNILPLSKQALKSLSLEQTDTYKVDDNENIQDKSELEELKQSLADTPNVGCLIELARTLDQARAILVFLDSCSEKDQSRQTIAMTAARGRGKSAAIGLCLAGAISFGYSTIVVTAPEPENLVAVFDFLLRGLKNLKYQEHMDFSITYNNAAGREATKCVLGIDIYRDHKQSIRYVRPDQPDKFSSAEIVAIDEAAAIPLTIVKALLGERLTFMSSTVNGYEGTGRALSLKLIKELRDSKTRGGAAISTNESEKLSVKSSSKKRGEAKVHEQRWEAAANAAAAAMGGASGKSALVEIELASPIRYSQGDPIESWLNKLLCLDCGTETSNRLRCGVPAPSSCELYHVNRDALFSLHKLSEAFLQKLMGLYTSAHYKNTPNDLQMLSDAPAHSVFVLLSPLAEEDSDSLPDILAVIQVALEGKISRKAVEAQLARGHRSAGDLIPWTISQQFGDSNFAQLSGARVVRIAVHPAVQGMGYGSRAIELLYRYYNGEMVDLLRRDIVSSENDSDDGAESPDESESEESNSGGAGIQEEKLKPRKKLPPLLLPLTDVKAPRLDWFGTSFGLTEELFRFWKRGGMSLLYLRQTKNELTAEHSSIMVRALPQRSGYDDAWLPAFSADTRRRIVSLLAGPFRCLDVKVVTSVLTDLADTSIRGSAAECKEASAALRIRSGNSSVIDATELNYLITPHDLKRLELYGRNLCDHHLISDLLPPISRLFFTGRLGDDFTLSSLQMVLLCGLGLQNKTVDDIVIEIGLPANQVLAMFNKAVRKISIALRNLVEQEEKSKMMSSSTFLEAERKLETLKHVTQQTLEEDAQEGSKEALEILENQESSLPPEIALDAELSKYVIRGTNAQWEEALQNVSSDPEGKDVDPPARIQIKTLNTSISVLKRKLDQNDIEKEAEANSKPSTKKSSRKPDNNRMKGKKSKKY